MLNVTIYTSYEPTAIKNVTRNTGICTFHIIGICLGTNMPATLLMYVLWNVYCTLHKDLTLLHISVKQTTKCNSNLPFYCHACISNKYALQRPHICHMPKLLNVYP